jgi:uncharacterized delta-60 repeat protein
MNHQTRPRRARWTAVLAAATLLGTALATSTATSAQALPADLDPGFAGAGRLTVGDGFRVVSLDQLADERFVTVSIRPTNTDAVDVRRFGPTGLPDATFGGDGDVQVGGPINWGVPAVAVDGLGNTYVSAYSADAGLSRVWRFNGAGALDPAWGGIGRVDFNGSRFLDIALQPDGRLVVANSASVYRLDAAGNVDPTFGTGGGVTLPTTQIDSLEVLPHGSIVAGGRGASSIDVFRLGPSGSIDSTFGSNGKATYRPTPPLGWTTAAIQQVSLGIQNDGRVVAASGADEQNATNGNHRFPLVVTRFTEKGAVDGTFTTTRDYDLGISGTMTLQADDKIVVPVSIGTRGSLLRLQPDGARDTSFGSNGAWSDTVADTRTTAAVVQTAGRIVVTGLATGKTGLVWAFQGDPTPTCKGRYATVYGGDGSDRLLGTSGDDVIVGGAGKDKIKGYGGDDRICGGSGKDTLLGAGGDDKIEGGADADVVKGKGGKDKIAGGGGNDKLYGGNGKDKLYGNGGRDRLFGGPGRDRLVGGPGRDVTRQ